jgi:hypothetical protein
MTLALTKFDLTEMNSSRAFPGSAYTPLPSFVKLGPRTWEIYKFSLVSHIPYLLLFQVCALHVTEGARARILKAGGTIMTFDQLALKAPKGKNTLLIQGKFFIESTNPTHSTIVRRRPIYTCFPPNYR